MPSHPVRRPGDGLTPSAPEADLDPAIVAALEQFDFDPWPDETDLQDECARDAAAPDIPGLVVIRGIGNPDTTDGRRIATAQSGILGKKVRFITTPDADWVGRKLADRFPHAAGVADAILAATAGRPHLSLPPFLLVGPPGVGKTSFALDLLAELEVPVIVYPCGGMSDSSLAGTPRRWVTGEPSLPFSMVSAHKVASPGIILDELEKTGTGTNNGRVFDALLGLLEPRSASEWLDPYIQATVDLSHVIWIATANTTKEIPGPLLDRFRILRFPAPDASHLDALASAMLRSAVQTRGLDARWATALEGYELDALRSAWRGGSLRGLGRLVEGVLAARDHEPRPN